MLHAISSFIWRSVDQNETYEQFRNHIRTQVNSVLYHRGKLKSQVNNAFIAWYREVARIAKLIDEKERGFVFAMSTGLKVRILIEDRVCAVPIAVIV